MQVINNAYLRNIILELLTESPGMSCRAIRKKLSETLEFEKQTIKNAMYVLLQAGKVYCEKTSIHTSYYFVNEVYSNNPIETRQIKIVPANQLPKLNGPIYRPMDWCLHQLQGQI